MRPPRRIHGLATGPTLTAPDVRVGLGWTLGLAALAAVAVYRHAFAFFFSLDDYTYLFRAAGIDPDPFTMRRLLGVRVYYSLGYHVLGLVPFGFQATSTVGDRYVYLALAGVALAVASGALASGGGYSLWYAALPHLSAVRAAILQLLVPVIAAAGGIVLLGERLTLRFAVGAAAIIGGVAVTRGLRRSRG